MRARGFWGLFFASQKISCATKTLLAHFLRDTSFLWHKYFCGQLLQLQNLLVFFDGLHLHFGRCCSLCLCNYALARLFSCVIVFLYDCVVVRGSFVCNIFSFCVATKLRDYAVASVS